MRAKQHFLIALGALALCSGAAIVAAQDEGQQPSPETTTQPTSPQAMPPEQSNMEDQMLTRGETERSSASDESQAQAQQANQDARDENAAHLVQNGTVQTPRSASVPQPSYPQQTEDELSARTQSTSSGTTSESSTAQSDSQSEAVAQVPAAQTPQPMQEPATPPERTSTLDETSMTRSSSSPTTPTVSEQPAQSESALDQGNTQLSDATASVQAKFDAIDTDHDGTIDRQEAAASDVLASQFDALDSSGDGKLSLAEFTAASNLASIRVDRRVHHE